MKLYNIACISIVICGFLFIVFDNWSESKPTPEPFIDTDKDGINDADDPFVDSDGDGVRNEDDEFPYDAGKVRAYKPPEPEASPQNNVESEDVKPPYIITEVTSSYLEGEGDILYVSAICYDGSDEMAQDILFEYWKKYPYSYNIIHVTLIDKEHSMIFEAQRYC